MSLSTQISLSKVRKLLKQVDEKQQDMQFECIKKKTGSSIKALSSLQGWDSMVSIQRPNKKNRANGAIAVIKARGNKTYIFSADSKECAKQKIIENYADIAN